MIPEDSDFSATKLEEINTSNTSRISSSSWSKLKDPRIVRVARAFGGKDRHSKVFTVRGLRDRRVRLSVPTAIQLYDLQERLGLNQPSKAVDWLLSEAKQAIDELPPLQIPQGSLISQSLHQYHPMFMNDSQLHRHEFLSPQSSDVGLKISSGISWGKDKDVSGGTSSHRNDDWGRNQEEEGSQLQLMHDPNQSGFSSSTSNFFSRQSLPSGISLPHNPFFRLDPSNMILPRDPQRSHEPSTSQTNNEDLHHRNFNLVQLPSISLGSHQVLLYHQPGMSSTTRAFNSVPSQISGSNAGFESKQQAADFHSFPLSNSSHTTSHVESDSQPVRPFQFSMTANLLPSQSSGAVDEQNSNNQLHS